MLLIFLDVMRTLKIDDTHRRLSIKGKSQDVIMLQRNKTHNCKTTVFKIDNKVLNL